METQTTINSSPGGIEIEPLRITQYKILTIQVAQELDHHFRRMAIATVVNKNSDGIWDGNTIHDLELKHCYNRASKGPNKTPYKELPGLIIDVLEIEGAAFGDLNIVTWTLLPNDIRM